jgi:glycosyltransferase involved in cell wall biosynthesis
VKAGVSIVICTYNGAQRLPQTLRHIAHQRVKEGVNWELILVDNASKDNSAQLAQEEWNNYSCTAPFTIVHQPIPGLSHAREMGFSTARYDCIIMCDDDNWLDENYVNVGFEIMQSHPRCALLGGYGNFVFETQPPSWLVNYTIYAGGPQAPASGKVPNYRLYGAGTILRKSAFYAIYEAGFRSLLADRMAAQLTSGGDHELCYGLALAGYEIRYDERLQFQHFITSDRLTWPYYRRYIKESAGCFEVLEAYKILLETNKTSWTSFYKRLSRSFLFHVKKWLPLVWKYQFMDKQSEAGKLTRIQCIILQTRLLSYFSGFSALRHNFTHVVALRAKLRSRIALPAETREIAASSAIRI